MIVSGDVMIRNTQPLQPIPDADVVCYGLWLGAEIAKDHGVFVSRRDNPGVMECMLQKPSPKKLAELSEDLGEAMVGINEQEIKVLMAERGK